PTPYYLSLHDALPISPQPYLTVDAGADQSVFTTSETFLSGLVDGVSPQDKRLGVLWRQIPDPYQSWAHIERPTSLHTRVHFMWPDRKSTRLNSSHVKK